MQCTNFSFYSECFIEEPCAGNPQARFCGGYHNTYTNFRHMLWFLPDIKSNFYKNSNLEIENKIPILTQAEKSCWHEAYGKEETRSAVIKHKPVVNKRKKVTNEQRQARIYSPKFKQYDKPKSLGDHYPLTTEECLELQSRSGRDFTQNAMNEILLDMSRKPKLQEHSFVSRARFMAYMATVYRYEGRDTVKTSNSSFKIMARATKSEVIAHTTQTQRDEFMATFDLCFCQEVVASHKKLGLFH